MESPISRVSSASNGLRTDSSHCTLDQRLKPCDLRHQSRTTNQYASHMRQSPCLTTIATSSTHRRLSRLANSNHLLRALLLLLLFFTSQVSSSGLFELRLDSFVNKVNRDASGRCCGQPIEGDQNCDQTCQTYFRVCFKNYQTNIDTSTECVYGQKLINVADSNDSRLNMTIRFPFSFAWPGTFSLIIEAWNNSTAPAKAATLISRTLESRPNRLRVGASWSEKRSAVNQTQLAYSYRVLCDQDYYTENCTKKCTPRNDVFGHYNCDANGEPACLAGWSGNYCLTPVCRNCNQTNGKCVAPDKCECRSGWVGKSCDECKPQPGCKNGYCSQPWECKCHDGWGGLFCQNDLNFCTNRRPCKNGGTCQNSGKDLFTCHCPAGFTGKTCEIEVDSCDHQPCHNGGTCKSEGLSSKYTCECPIGYQGRHCEHLTSACSNNPCENEGTCVDGPSGFMCICKHGYSGSRCQVQQKDCTPNPCQNGANCVSNSTEGGYQCQCRAGFTGHHCEVNIDDCESDPCLNSGTCVDEINSFRCLCVPGFVGELCQKNVDDCLMKPCANGGTCMDRNNDYLCLCPSGFRGKDCSLVDHCASRPCANGGHCRERNNGFECQCAPGFSGSRCERNTTRVYLDSQASTYSAMKKASSELEDEEANTFSTTQLVFIIFGSISLPLIAIIISIAWILCKHWRNYDSKIRSRRDADEARRQNERNAVMSSGMNNKCFDQCRNPSAAKVIVNALDRPASMHHLNKCHNYPKATNEYVYGRQLEKSATLHKGFKVVNENGKMINTDEPVYGSHTYEHIQKPYCSYLQTNLQPPSQPIYQSTKQSNLEKTVYEPVKVATTTTSTPSCDLYGESLGGNRHSNIQLAASLQRLNQPTAANATAAACRMNSVYVIDDHHHYSQPVYSDPPPAPPTSKLHATEV